jgi:hypothetical protein
VITSFNPNGDTMTYFWENAEWALGTVSVDNHTNLFYRKPHTQHNVWLHLKVFAHYTLFENLAGDAFE